MQLQGFHPLTVITVFVLIGGILANFFTLEWRSAPISHVIASLLLASPFALLLAAHVTMASTWRRSLYLAVGSVLFIVPWMFISFAIRWFQAGWAGIAAGSAVLVTLALGYLALALLIKEKT